MKLILNFIFLTAVSAQLFAEGKNDTIISGVPIRFDYDLNIFPESWLEEPIDAIGDEIDESEIPRSKHILITALNKYPQVMLNENLKGVYVLKNMAFYDVRFGGTNSNEYVYLTNNGVVNGYTNEYVESTLHHEFSSILYRNHPEYLDRDIWDRISKTGNADPDAGVGAIREGNASTDIDTAYCRIGFLSQYSQSDFENDLNVLAENLFNPAPGFWDIVHTYPLIREKTRLLIQFYHSFDPVFTERYFRGLKVDF